MKKSALTLLVFIVVAIACYCFVEVKYPKQGPIVSSASPASPVPKPTPSAPSAQNKIRILIVPGHEPNDGGTNFGDIYERNLVVEIGQDLQQFLDADPKYQTFITRDTADWTPTFADYFKNDWNDIVAWEHTAKENAALAASTTEQSSPTEEHNDAQTDVALRLFGIIKWSDENSINLMIHIHLNNYPGSPSDVAGKYSGFVMYMPAQQYGNSSSTKPIAQAVFNRLSLYNPVSNLPVESSGLIADPELIAIGADNTSAAASILVEYDYIYEPQFVNPAVRSIALKDLAYQTYLGLEDYYGTDDGSSTPAYNPTLVYQWTTPVTGNTSDPKDIYALQTALMMDGDYPPKGQSKNDCPHSGTFGACTRAAVEQFQAKNNIQGESSSGPQTSALLFKVYSGQN